MAKKQEPQLVRYFYSPRGIEGDNKGGWRLGTLLKTGYRLYHIQTMDGKVKRYRIKWTKVKDDG